MKAEWEHIAEDIRIGSGSSMLSGVDWHEKDTARRVARERVLKIHAPALLQALAAVEAEVDVSERMRRVAEGHEESLQQEVDRLEAEVALLRTVAQGLLEWDDGEIYDPDLGAYTRKTVLPELRAWQRTQDETKRPQPPYPWCHGNPTIADCIEHGYCRRDPNCGE